MSVCVPVPVLLCKYSSTVQVLTPVSKAHLRISNRFTQVPCDLFCVEHQRARARRAPGNTVATSQHRRPVPTPIDQYSYNREHGTRGPASTNGSLLASPGLDGECLWGREIFVVKKAAPSPSLFVLSLLLCTSQSQFKYQTLSYSRKWPTQRKSSPLVHLGLMLFVSPASKEMLARSGRVSSARTGGDRGCFLCTTGYTGRNVVGGTLTNPHPSTGYVTSSN